MSEQNSAAEHKYQATHKDAESDASEAEADREGTAANEMNGETSAGGESTDAETGEGQGETGTEPEADWRSIADSRYEQLIRLQADFENFRRRAERDRVESEAQIIGRILHDLLSVYDNLERAVKFMPTEGEAKAWRVGVEMTLNGFNEVLGRLGVQPVATVGVLFNPSLHEAVQQVESTWPEGVVAEEVQKGFRWRDRVLRAALVKVSSGGGQQPDAQAPTDDEK